MWLFLFLYFHYKEIIMMNTVLCEKRIVVQFLKIKKAENGKNQRILKLLISWLFFTFKIKKCHKKERFAKQK